MEMRDAAALLSLLAVSVAEPNELAGLVVVAVKLALERSAVTVRPISTRAERAMPARRAAGLRIAFGSLSFRLAAFRFRAVVTRGTIGSGLARSIGPQGGPAPSLVRLTPEGGIARSPPGRVS